MRLQFTNGISDLAAWRRQVRSKLLELTGFTALPNYQWEITDIIEKEEAERIHRRYSIRCGNEMEQPIYEFLPPKGKYNGITLIAFHGHGNSLEDPIYDYLHELPRLGYRLVTPVLYGCMERQTLPIIKQGAVEQCRIWSVHADRRGASLLGIRLQDARLAFELAVSLEGVNPERIGCIGLSMGGEMALYYAAVETRVAFSVSAGFFSSFDGLLFKKPNCQCYSIRGWANWLDMPDIAACISPRPLLILRGYDDPWVDKEDAACAFRRLKKIYAAAGAETNCSYREFPGEHQLNTKIAQRWILTLYRRCPDVIAFPGNRWEKDR